jgi:hypothetical protein
MLGSIIGWLAYTLQTKNRLIKNLESIIDIQEKSLKSAKDRFERLLEIKCPK